MDSEQIACRLVGFYQTSFGGKALGRYRISMKNLRELAGQKRMYPDEIADIARELYQKGYILIDMETFFVVINQKTFSSYRRVNDALIS